MRDHDWSNVHIDLIAEFISGCRWNCSGCGVPKNSQRPPTLEEAKELSSLLEDLSQSGYTLDHIEIGPTDFAGSANFSEILDRQDLMKLVEKFETLILQSTALMVSDDLLYKMARIFGDRQINLYLVAGMDQISRPNYLERVEENVTRLKESLNIRKLEVFYNTQDYPHEVLLESATIAKDRFNTWPWHVVSASRTQSINENKIRLSTDIKRLQKMFNGLIQPDQEWTAHFQHGNRIKPTNRAYVWSHGDLYWPPVLYGHFVNYDQRFKLPHPLSIASIQEWEKSQVVQQYSGVSGKSDCEQCPHLGQCVNQGILNLMDELGETNCVAPREAFDVYRNVSSQIETHPGI